MVLTHLGPAVASIGNAHFFVDEMQQPHGSHEQELQVLHKTWLLTLDFVTNELAYPRQDKNQQAQLP